MAPLTLEPVRLPEYHHRDDVTVSPLLSAAPRAPEWEGFTQADAGVLVAKVEDSPAGAVHAFCRSLDYAAQRGRRFTIKPAWLAKFYAETTASPTPLPVPTNLFVGGWLVNVMNGALEWFNARGRTPQGYRVNNVDGELTLLRYPEEPPNQPGLIFDDADGSEWVAIHTLRLADNLGWPATETGAGWRLWSWRAEFEPPTGWSDRAVDKLFGAAEEAVEWMNGEPALTPDGRYFHFDDRDQLWLSGPEPAKRPAPATPAATPRTSMPPVAKLQRPLPPGNTPHRTTPVLIPTFQEPS